MKQAPPGRLEAEGAVRKAVADNWAAGRDCSVLTDDLLGFVCQRLPDLSREEVLLVLNHIRSF